MRFYTVLASLFILAGGGLGIFHPEVASSVADDAAKSLERYLFDKEVQIVGSERLSRDDIDPLLPHRLSNFQWFMQPEVVTQQLKQHPLVQGSTLTRCTNSPIYSFACFKLTVIERRAKFVALLGQQPWVVGHDGVFMFPLNSGTTNDKLLRRISADLSHTVMVRGLLDQSESPDYVRGKMEMLLQISESLNDRSGMQVEKIIFEPGEEIAVQFKQLPFIVHFDYSPGKPDKLEDQIDRLRIILADLRGQLSGIDAIDLAYDKLGVVKRR